MREFFNGWRRKAGVVTLVLACVFTAGWVRSFTTLDGLFFNPGPTRLMLFSTVGKLSLAIRINGELKHEPFYWLRRPPAPAAHRLPDDPFEGPFSTRWSLFGFEFKEMARLPYPIWTVPYWSIVLPLTLLSAWLLLSKPRVAKPKIVAES